MDTSMHYESSAGELSSPPSGSLSVPGSPPRPPHAAPNMNPNQAAPNNDPRLPHDPSRQYETSTTAGGQSRRFGYYEGEWVQLTAAGVPRKKPGRKPGHGSNKKPAETGDNQSGQTSASEHTKVRKPRKPRDPNVPAQPRKRKIAPAGLENGPESTGPGSKMFAFGTPGPPSSQSSPQNRPTMPAGQHQTHAPPLEHQYSPKGPSREAFPLQSILNADPPLRSQSTSNVPVRTVGQSYDPIRDGKYDPVRETVVANTPYSNSGSPRAPSQAANRSPSIASIIDPAPSSMRSPGNSHSTYHQATSSSQPRFQPHEAPPPVSPSQPLQAPKPASQPPPSRPAAQEPKKEQPPGPPPVPRPIPKESNFTTIANGPVRKVSPKQKPQTGASTPKTDNLDDLTQEGEGRSILDFGRAKPGEEAQTPTIVLNIPIKSGETNKYVNFMRLAEDRYGWDALHPRLAADRDRKARIAAATASLEKTESGRESGDEMSDDVSDNEGSNADNGGTSGAEALAKPKKKRKFKEDDYDVDDDFVDDSEMLWEAQAAASRDGFFVYSGPLVPEVEEPPAGYALLFTSNVIAKTNNLVARMVPPSVVAAAAVEAVAAEGVHRLVVVLRLDAEAAQDPEAALSQESLGSPNLKRRSVIRKRPSARA